MLYVDLLSPPLSLCFVLSAVRESWSQVCDMTKPVYHKAMAGQHLCSSSKFMSSNTKHFCLAALFCSTSVYLTYMGLTCNDSLPNGAQWAQSSYTYLYIAACNINIICVCDLHYCCMLEKLENELLVILMFNYFILQRRLPV